MTYFLVMLSTWRFSCQEFKGRLLERWPATRLKEEADLRSLDCYEFEIPMEHSTLEGSLRRDGTGLAFDGDIRDFTQFSLWVRALVPPTERLFFCDEGMSGSTDLEPTSSPDDIYRLYDYAPPPPGWMNYCLIASPSWNHSPQDFARLLRTRWPNAQVQLEPDSHPHRTLSFLIPLSHSTLIGDLTRVRPRLYFTGDIRDCAEFSFWCRSALLPMGASVLSEKSNLTLQPSTSVEEFIRALDPPLS